MGALDFIYSIPYLMISNPYIPLLVAYEGFKYGGLIYILISLGIFGVHLLIRKITGKKFDLPVNLVKNAKIKQPYLSGFLASLFFGIFASAYFGFIQKNFVDNLEKIILESIGVSILKYVPPIAFALAAIYVITAISGKRIIDENRNLTTGGVIIIAIVAFLWTMLALVLKPDVNAVINTPMYLYGVQFLLGAPSLWAAKMLFVGFTEEEYAKYFSD